MTMDLVSGPEMKTPYSLVHAERIRAHVKHGELSAEVMEWDNPRWLPIVIEEIGEVALVINERDLGNISPEGARQAITPELTQVAAMLCAWLEKAVLSA